MSCAVLCSCLWGSRSGLDMRLDDSWMAVPRSVASNCLHSLCLASHQALPCARVIRPPELENVKLAYGAMWWCDVWLKLPAVCGERVFDEMRESCLAQANCGAGWMDKIAGNAGTKHFWASFACLGNRFWFPRIRGFRPHFVDPTLFCLFVLKAVFQRCLTAFETAFNFKRPSNMFNFFWKASSNGF